MKVGSIVFATEQGLGFLAKDFYDHGVITHPVVIRHGGRRTIEDWYPPEAYSFQKRGARLLDVRRVEEYFRGMDAVLFFETPFFWELLRGCSRYGVKTALMPMYECMPSSLPRQPDLIINPSLLDQEYYPEGVHIPVPVPDFVTWKERSTVRTFVHNAGNGGLRGRNGTGELLEALKYVDSPIELILRFQTALNHDIPVNPNIILRVVSESVPVSQLYSEGEVFIFPDKFNGLSLPLQEAYASGMAVMATNRFPANRYLPTDLLIPVKKYEEIKIHPRLNTISEAIVEPRDIVRKIDEWFGKDISQFSFSGKQWAEENSWERLKPEYLKALS